MFTVYVGSIMTTAIGIMLAFNNSKIAGESAAFVLSISAWLWFAVLFANFAEAMAEGRGEAQAESLRMHSTDII